MTLPFWPEIKLLTPLQICPCRLHWGAGSEPTDRISGLHARLSQQGATRSHCSPTRVHKCHQSCFCFNNRQPVPEGLFLLSAPNLHSHILAGRPLSHQVSPLYLYHNSSKCFSVPSPVVYFLRTSQVHCCEIGGGGCLRQAVHTYVCTYSRSSTSSRKHTHIRMHIYLAFQSPNEYGEERILPSQRAGELETLE